MSLESFLKEILETQKEEVEKIIELQKILEQITLKEEPRFYLISVVSNE